MRNFPRIHYLCAFPEKCSRSPESAYSSFGSHLRWWSMMPFPVVAFKTRYDTHRKWDVTNCGVMLVTGPTYWNYFCGKWMSSFSLRSLGWQRITNYTNGEQSESAFCVLLFNYTLVTSFAVFSEYCSGLRVEVSTTETKKTSCSS